MYISAGSTTRSVRSHPLGDGELLIVGGEGHKTGQGGSTTERYRHLEQFAHEHWDVREIEYRWASQDCQPADGLPYVGKVSPISKHLWTGTGFRKWGLTNGTAAAMILADRLLDRDNPWAGTLDSNRFAPARRGDDAGQGEHQRRAALLRRPARCAGRGGRSRSSSRARAASSASTASGSPPSATTTGRSTRSPPSAPTSAAT